MLNYFIIYFLKVSAIVFGYLLRPFRRNIRKDCPIQCLILAYCGVNNTGAEARVSEMIEQLNNEFKDSIYIKVFTLNKALTHRYIKHYKNVELVESHPVNVFKNSLIIAKSHINILAEGSTFDNTFSDVLLWFYLYFIDLSNKLGIYTVTYGVDAGKIHNHNRAYCKEIASKIDLLMLRSEKSRKIIENIGVKNNIKITADTVFTLNPEDDDWCKHFLEKNNITFQTPIIVIAYRDFYCWPVKIDLLKYFTGNKENQFIDVLYYTLRAEDKKARDYSIKAQAEYADYCVQNYNARIIFVAMESNDNNILKNVSRQMRQNSIIVSSDEYNAREIAAIIKISDLIVTARYHALIFALIFNRPFILLAPDARTSGIFEEIQIDCDYCIDYFDKDLLKNLYQATEKVFKEKESIVSHLKKILPDYQSRMNLNIKYFKDFTIEKGLFQD